MYCRAFVCLLAVCCLVATTAFASETQVQFFDQNGNLVTGQTVGVMATGADGSTTKLELAPQADGTYAVPVGPGADVRFKLYEQNPSLTSAEVSLKVPAGVGPVAVTVPFGGPANDLCADGQSVAVPSVTSGTTIGSTADAAPFCGTSNTSPGVWYTVIGTGTTLTASTCETVPGGGSASFDTKISVYCQDCAALTCLAGNDDITGCSFHSAASWCAQSGGLYRILVHGFSASTGNFALAVTSNGASCAPTANCLPPVPQGACCVNAEPPFEQGTIAVDCFEGSADDCAAAGGNYQGDDSTCFEITNTFSYANNTLTPIPDNTPAGVNSTITVPDSFAVADVNVGIGITHTWVSDLIVTITGPGGGSQVLWNQVCGSTDNIRATADDEGTETFCAPINAGPVNAVFFPPALAGAGPLSIFDTTEASGVWTLNVSDNFAADTGSINEWTLTFDAGAGICPALECSGDDDDDDNGPTCLTCPVESDGKVTICHRPPGNPANAHTIRISPAALGAHCSNHGDSCGPCTGNQPQTNFTLTPEGQTGNGPVVFGQNNSATSTRDNRGSDRPTGSSRR